MIMRLLNDASATDLMLVPGILKEFEELPAWLKLRFQKGSLYQDEDRVFGWCRDDQIQAVELPVYLDMFSYDNGNENRIVKYIRVGVSDEEGFAPAIDLPFDGVRVEVPVAPGYNFDYTFFTMWEHGWASPCEIQWSWFERPRCSDLDGYVVERSIIPHGFWKAWEWYPDCWRDYYDKRPELFEDAEWWGTPMPIRHEPPNDPYAAVLGGANKHDVEIFFLDS
ncbi:MAG: hypothetical protein EAZ78_27685 [Oscillatoriales cyanobacterium]|nr:MAG: hypothetical protein EAZ78_27685 [Oscillatoriales cyanobacterium]